MNMKQLPYIIAISNTGSFSTAADRLGVSQPALSKYLAELEKELGLRLFLRNKKRLHPTSAGQIYIDAARKILEIQTQTLNSIHALSTDKRYWLHIGATPHRGALVLAKVYPQFARLFPYTELVPREGYASQVREYVRSGEVSLAMTTYRDEEESDLQFLPLFDEELVLSVPHFHRLAQLAYTESEQLAVIDIVEFRDTPFVLMGANTTIGIISQRVFAEAGFSPMSIYTSNNVLMVDEIIRAGMGVGLIPRDYAVKSKDVVYFRLKHPCYFTTCIVSSNEHEFTKEERYLIYLQLKLAVESPHYRLRWSKELRNLVDEFDLEVLSEAVNWEESVNGHQGA